jgi:hypothetical protein
MVSHHAMDQMAYLELIVYPQDISQESMRVLQMLLLALLSWALLKDYHHAMDQMVYLESIAYLQNTFQESMWEHQMLQPVPQSYQHH